MKKITLLIVVLISSFITVNAQVNTYTFSKTNETYTPITGGTVLGNNTNDNQIFVNPANLAGETTTATSFGVGFPIGFNFTFAGYTFDRFGVNTNGWIAFGKSSTTPSVDLRPNSGIAFTPITGTNGTFSPIELRCRVAGFGGNIIAQTTSELRYELIGTAPNRTLVVQWKEYSRALTTFNFNFQIRINESGVVSVVYGTMSFVVGTNSFNAQVGLGGTDTIDSNVLRVTSDFNNPLTSTTHSDSCSVSSTTTPPVFGLTYNWTPNIPCTGTPVNASVSPSSLSVCTGVVPSNLVASGIPVTSTGLTYQWEQSSNNFATAGINAVGGSGANTKTYSPPAFLGASIYYRLKVTCSNSGLSSYSNTVTISPSATSITPTFTAVNPICSGATLSALPTTSNNGITGTWSPAINNTNTTTYTFTPTLGQCATTTTMTITVNPNVTPTFTAVGPFCSGAIISPLPTTSNNGITGTWSPAINNTATITYTFTPTSGQCATTANMTITVNTTPLPIVTTPAFYIQGTTASPLTATGSNLLWYTTASGGTGSTTAPTPSTVAIGSTTYWVTQNTGSCGESVRVKIDVVVSAQGSNLRFDGTNDRISTPNATNLQIANNFTIEFWFKSQSVSQTQKYIFSKENAGAQYAIIYEYVDNQIEFYSSGGSTGTDPRSNSQIAINDTNWHHIAYTYDGSTWKGYKDGNFVFSVSGIVFSLNPLSGANLFLGGSSTGNNTNMNMDEFRIWNRALPQTEIQNNLNCELPTGQTGLLLYYKFNQGAANGINTGLTTISDLSGNNNNGVLNNFALSGSASNWVDNSIITSGTTCSPFLNLNSFENETFKAFPNPVKDVLYVTNNHEMDEVMVLNMLGQTLISKKIKDIEANIDLSSLAKGNYFVKIMANGKAQTVKIIKE